MPSYVGLIVLPVVLIFGNLGNIWFYRRHVELANAKLMRALSCFQILCFGIVAIIGIFLEFRHRP